MDTAFTEKQTYPQFLRFILPSIVSMVTLSFYTTVDGFFVSRFVNAEALASINIIIPFTCLVYGIALMLASGSGAYVGIKMGEGSKKEADGLFSFTVYSLVAISLIVTALSLVFLNPILRLLGSTDLLMPYTTPYGLVTVLMTLPMMLKLFFEHFARIDGNPNLAFIMSTSGLVMNVIFDFLFIVPMKMGILGAALGTFASVAISGSLGLIYFIGRKSNLKFTKPVINMKYLLKSSFNGSSQMLTELSTGVVTLLFNISILKFQGEYGVAAMSIVTFIYYFFIAVYMGVSVGASPIISYSYGAGASWRTKLVLKHSAISIAWMSAGILALSLMAGPLMIRIFTEELPVIAIAERGLALFSWCFLFTGVNIFMSALFTAVGNGRVAAIISAMRCLVLTSAAILLLPLVLGEAGIWIAMPVAEFLTLFLSAYYYFRYQKSLYPPKERLAPQKV